MKSGGGREGRVGQVSIELKKKENIKGRPVRHVKEKQPEADENVRRLQTG